MKDFSILSTIILVSVLLGAGLYLFGGPQFHGQRATTPGFDSPVRFTVLQSGTNAPSLNERVNYLIVSENELTQLWQMVYGNNGPEVPTIDFAGHDVLAVFDGSHSQGGYHIAISRIEDVGGKRVVTVVRTSPAANCTSGAESSAPFEIVTMNKSTLTLDHADTYATSTLCN